jgi:hypothetical protein
MLRQPSGSKLLNFAGGFGKVLARSILLIDAALDVYTENDQLVYLATEDSSAPRFPSRRF